MSDEPRFDTRAIHAGQDPESLYGAVNVPIYQTSTYAQDGVGRPKAWDYGRGGNPTREALQRALSSLEGGEACFAFASGMAAESTLLLTLRPGDHVVLADDVYGGTFRLLSKVLVLSVKQSRASVACRRSASSPWTHPQPSTPLPQKCAPMSTSHRRADWSV